MLFGDLVKQLYNAPPVILMWDSFAKKLEALMDDFQDADSNFIQGVADLCILIRNGFATSISHPNGFSLDSQWVIDSFSKVFQPLLIEAFPDTSQVWVEFLFAQIPIPFDKHLSKSECRNFADKLMNASAQLAGPVSDSLRVDNDLLKDAATLELLAKVLYLINTELPDRVIDWCECCFRRAPPNSKHCSLHRPVRGKSEYHKGIKDWYKQINEVDFKWARYRFLRMVFDDTDNIYIHSNDSTSQILLSHEVNYERYIGVQAENSAKALLDATLNIQWVEAAKLWDEFIKVEHPHIDVLLQSKASSCNTWSDFVVSIRFALQESLENNSHPYWIICEITMAEIYFKCEDSRNNLKFMDRNLVRRLSNEGFKPKDIMKQVNLKKSQVYQIIKDVEKERLHQPAVSN